MTAPAADIDWALETIKGRGDRYKLYRDYYGGNHRVAFATDKWRSSFGALFSALADNLCPAIVDAVADRVQLSGLKSTGVDLSMPEATDPLGDTIAQVWDANLMARRTGEVHLEALREGDSYVIVWPGRAPGTVTIVPQKAHRVCVSYDEGADEPGTIRVAAKAWPLNAKATSWALNLYYPDRIEKLITNNAANSAVMPDKANMWGPRTDPGEEAATVNHAFGRVPVFHFANNASTGDDCGVSELKDWIPLQDSLNKSIADMLVAMEFQALPQRWIAGLEIVYDPQGNVVPAFEPGADRIWQFVSENTKAGQFDAADLEKFIKVSDSFRAEGARVTRTPLHYLLLEGRFPSGDALEVATQPLESKVRDRRSSYGEAWEQVFEFAIGTILGRGDIDLEATWGDTQPNDELKHAQAIQAKRDLGISKRQGLRELGYTEDQIDLFEAENEAAAPQIAQGAADAFNRGGPAAFGLTALDGGQGQAAAGQ
jgi:hypothetical protein